MKQDWEAARARVARAGEALARALDPGAGRIAEIFHQRAVRLARPALATDSASAGQTVLVFSLGKLRYAIELEQIAEVLANASPVPVPGAPPELRGVVQVRGEIRPVWELARLLEVEWLDAGQTAYVLLVRIGGHEVGLRVGAVEGIRTVRPEETTPGRSPGAVKWITADLVSVLDPQKLLGEGQV